MRLLLVVALALGAHAAAHAQPSLDSCLQLVVPYAPGAQQPADDAFTLELDTPAGGLRYLGARHSTDPSDAQFSTMRAAFDAFVPTVAFYEGPNRPLEETAEATIRSVGESGYTRFLARSAGIPIARLEPEPQAEFAAVVEAVGLEEAILFFVLRETARLRDRGGVRGEELDAAVAALLDRAASAGLPLSSIDSLGVAYARHFDSPADWRDAPSAWFDPLADDRVTGGQFMASANRASSNFRNVHMARVLAEAARMGRVFAVVGRNHVPMQAPALRCALAAE